MSFVTKKYVDDGLKTKVNKAWVRDTSMVKQVLTSLEISSTGNDEVSLTQLGSKVTANEATSKVDKVVLTGITSSNVTGGVKLDATPTLDAAKAYTDDVVAAAAAAVRDEAIQFRANVTYFGNASHVASIVGVDEQTYLATNGDFYKNIGGAWVKEAIFELENGYLYNFSQYTDSPINPKPPGWAIRVGTSWSLRVDQVNAVDDVTIARNPDSTIRVKEDSLDETQFTPSTKVAIARANDAVLQARVRPAGNGRRQLLRAVEVAPQADDVVVFKQHGVDVVTGSELAEPFKLILKGGLKFDFNVDPVSSQVDGLVLDGEVEYEPVF